MALDLETTKAEMLDSLKEAGLAVFYGYPRLGDFPVYWDTERHSDFREFVSVAVHAGARLIVFCEQQFSAARIEDARFQIEECDLTAEQTRSFENRLRKFEAYEAFTCSLSLSFHLEGQVYIFEVKTDWLRSFHNLLDEIDSYLPEGEDAEDDKSEGPLGGYFSNN